MVGYLKRKIANVLVPRARDLRARSTRAEEVLWECLRNRRLAGHKFRRQHPVARFIVDFYCEAHRLAVEIDGGCHDDPDHAARDTVRTEALAALGIRLVRFRNDEVLLELESVLARLRNELPSPGRAPPHPASGREPPHPASGHPLPTGEGRGEGSGEGRGEGSGEGRGEGSG
jgi:very-short-patch-repair endonuclease